MGRNCRVHTRVDILTPPPAILPHSDTYRYILVAMLLYARTPKVYGIYGSRKLGGGLAAEGSVRLGESSPSADGGGSDTKS
eukprot:gene9641-biopygen2841